MKILRFCDSLKEKIVLLPGCFDGMHRGHMELIKQAFRLKEQCGAKLAILTFDDPFSAKVKGEKLIFTLEERKKLLLNNYVDYLIIIKSTKHFLAQTYQEFLQGLCKKYNIYSIVCGEDFTFGKGACGNVDVLKKFFEEKNVSVKVVGDIVCDNEKVSSSLIKKKLAFGDIEGANKLLGFEYFFCGEVIHGESVGADIGFPTANVEFNKNKKPLKLGVYKTKVCVDGAWYDAITNFGCAPTFNRKKFIIETHIKNFNSDIYGKNITVSFVCFIRETIKFKSADELIKQLEKDKQI